MYSEAMRKQAEEVQAVFVASMRKILKQNKIRHKDFAKVLGMNLNSFERKMNHNKTVGFRLDEALRIAYELAESVEDLARGIV